MKTSTMLSFLLITLIVGTRCPAVEIDVFMPSELANLEGNDRGANTGLVPYHTQHYWPAAGFRGLPDGYGLITQVAFRPDFSVMWPIEIDVADMEVVMSTTAKSASELSPEFSENHGSDESLVRDGPITLRTENTGPDGGPRDFDYVVDLQTPFHYDPANGNLLIDVRSPAYGQAAYYDYHVGTDDGAMVWAPSLSASTGDVLNEVMPMRLTFAMQPSVLMPGDANQDLDFDQLDLIQVLQSNKYMTGESATWGQGDWDGAPGGSPGSPPAGDGLFDQFDILAALAEGHYLAGPYAALTAGDAGADMVAAIPEPSTALLLLLGVALLRSVTGPRSNERSRHTVY